MNKRDFINLLRTRLSALPQRELDDRLGFYSEMIDDRIEEGLGEEEAVAQIGSVDEIAAQIVADIPFIKIVSEKVRPKRRLTAWEILLLSLGSPIWLSLIVAALSVLLSLWASVWAVVLSLWAGFVSLAAVALGAAVAGIALAFMGHGMTGVALLGGGTACAGLSIFFFFGCVAATKGLLLLTRRLGLALKKCFIKKEGAQ